MQEMHLSKEMEVFLDETAQVLGMGNYNMFSFDNVYGLQEKVTFGEWIK